MPQSPTEIPSESPCLLPTEYPSVLTRILPTDIPAELPLNVTDGISVGKFSTHIRLQCRRHFRWYCFFLITDRNGDGIIITDAHDTDGINPSEIPSVIILPTGFVPYTDGINPSAKLYNGVVLVLMNRVTGLVSLPEITRVTFFILFLD